MRENHNELASTESKSISDVGRAKKTLGPDYFQESTIEEIHQIEEIAGCKIPDDYKEFLLIYIADVSETTRGLYRLRNGVAEHVVVPESPAGTAVWRVDAADGVLWVLESKALNRFDGASWERFVHPNA